MNIRSTAIDFAPRSIRVGLIVPSSNTNFEPDCAMLAPSGVTLHAVRSGGYNVNAIPDSALMRRFARESLDQCVTLLIDARVDMVIYGCTSATLSEGPVYDRQFCDELEEKAGVPSITAAGALIEAVNSIGARRVAFTSPYVAALSAESVSFIRESGIEVVSELGFKEELSSLGQNALTPQDAYDMALRVDHPDAEAIVISCTDYRALEAVPAIEAALGKPVITSNQAQMFVCLTRMGLPTTGITKGGRLFTRQGLVA
ncbi:maleate cis-trans isomerase family protein [Celeribacter halophilus]|uniref:maleate cis-trans isomerase family protein n=1 Tax=Celeribacter halophilus TaxID=576117 RepID=UPI001C0A2825|nr:aspartate/glutamate racemase family protein [Celeribacter halophilus]MBU2888123.1 aspartate/glutamate racemase family protein [Celeribacter halophilus]MDO6511869.1 aspartate/glutamate racemase family protein [Celeribacter halophilus]